MGNARQVESGAVFRGDDDETCGYDAVSSVSVSAAARLSYGKHFDSYVR